MNTRWGYKLLRVLLRLMIRVLFNFKATGLRNILKDKTGIRKRGVSAC